MRKSSIFVIALIFIAVCLPLYGQDHLARGEDLYFAGRYEEAASELEKAIAENPNAALAYRWLVKTYGAMGRGEEILDRFRELSRANPGSATYHYALGAALHQMQMYDEALEEFKKALELDPNLVEAHNDLADTYSFGKNMPGEAVAEYERALKLRPDFWVTYNNLGVTYEKLDRYDEALRELKRSLELKPGSKLVQNNLQRLETILKNREAVEKNPGDLEARMNLARAYEGAGKFEDAIREYREAISLNAEYELAYLQLGFLHYRLNELSKAQPLLKRAFELNPFNEDTKSLLNLTEAKLTLETTPQDPKAQFQAGEGFLYFEQYEDAIAAFREYLRLKPKYTAIAHRNIGIALLRSGAVEEAAEAFQRSLEDFEDSDTRNWLRIAKALKEISDNPQNARPYFEMGEAHSYEKNYEYARREYQKALQIDPTLKVAEESLKKLDRRREADEMVRKGIKSYTDEGPQGALEAWENALAIYREMEDDFNEAFILGNIGLVHQNLGEPEKALENYLRALEIERRIKYRRGEAVTLEGLGSTYRELGNNEEALKSYIQALEISRQIGYGRGEIIALKNIGSLYKSSGDRKGALRYQQEALSSARRIKDPWSETDVLVSISHTYYLMGEYSEATRYQQKALEVTKGIGNKPGEAMVLGNIALIRMSMGNLDEALDSALAAWKIAEGSESEEVAYRTQWILGKAHWKKKKYEEAYRALKMASDIAEFSGKDMSPEKFGDEFIGKPEDLQKDLEGLRLEMQKAGVPIP
ncbi:MAG: tetratricopeptide repeat protein [bacterium]